MQDEKADLARRSKQFSPETLFFRAQSDDMDEHQIFDSLARNAFDFLERGIAEFDSSPKYSVIHFCAAVEMLLKARLMKEHWSLVVSKPEQASLTKFVAGDFMSVTMYEARQRLRDIVGEELSDDAFASFRTLANHRNKMIHFFHAGIEGDEKVKAQIVGEQCRSWFHLHRLFDRWNSHFREFRVEIRRADKGMKGHRKYLAAKFQALRPELAARQKQGSRATECGACGYKAAIPKQLDPAIAETRCLVCDHTEVQVEIDCPHCSKHVVLSNEGYGTCRSCGRSIEPEHIVDALIDHGAAHIAARDGDDSYQEANCGSCDGHHTVLKRGGKYFCANCFEISASVEFCGWCNETNTGDMEQSYSTGCNHCDGWIGHQKDD